MFLLKPYLDSYYELHVYLHIVHMCVCIYLDTFEDIHMYMHMSSILVLSVGRCTYIAYVYIHTYTYLRLFYFILNDQIAKL